MMKKAIISAVLVLISIMLFLIISIDDLNRESICLIFNSSESDKGKELCSGDEFNFKGFEDARFRIEKDSEFKWMLLEKNSTKCFVGLYSLKLENEQEKDVQSEIRIQESTIHEIEKPSFPDLEADIVAIILKVEGNSELLEEKVEEIFLHFQTDFRHPDIFYVYGARIPERIKLLKNTEIVHIYNKPEITVTDLTLIRSNGKKLYLDIEGTKRIRAK